MNTPTELTVARQRIAAFGDCGHPLAPTAVWLLAEVERLRAETPGRHVCDCQPFRDAQQPGTDNEGWQAAVGVHDDNAWPPRRVEPYWEVGLDLLPLKFCPWCGGRVPGIMGKENQP